MYIIIMYIYIIMYILANNLLMITFNTHLLAFLKVNHKFSRTAKV